MPNSEKTPSNEALETLVGVQQMLTETISLLDKRADLLGLEEPESLTEMRALFNTVKGLRCLVEVQTLQANASS